MKKPFLVSQKERWEYLISKGQLAGRNKDSVSAIEYFEAAYKVSRYFSKRDRIRQQSAYYLGYAKFATSDKTGAITYLEEFLKHPKSAEDSENEVADVHTELGACFYGSDNEKATEHFVKALQIKKRLGLSTLEIDVMLGSIKMMREDYAGAIPLYESAYQVQKKEDENAAQQLAVQLAYAHRALGDSSGELRWQKENLRWRMPKTQFSSEDASLQIREDVPNGRI